MMRYLVILIFRTQMIVSATVCPSCTTNQMLPQCPCVRPPTGSGGCMSYDSTYLASSIDEAMFSFPNLASYDGQPLYQKKTLNKEPEMHLMAMSSARIQDTTILDDSDCSSEECQLCKLSIVSGFVDCATENRNDTLVSEKQKLQTQTGKTQGSCSRQQPKQKTRKQLKKERKNMENERKAKQVFNILGSFKSKKKRIRRTSSDDKATAEKEKLLGVTNQIGCDYKRGTELEGNGDWVGLCNLCWQWRRLPDKYFPNYINEVSCDSKDNGCLSGFGSCRAVTRVLNVLQNRGTAENPIWEQISIESAAACECQVEVGTPLHYLAAR